MIPPAMLTVPFDFPGTETAHYVRSVMHQRAEERAAVSSDPPFKLATEFLRALVGDVPHEVAEQAIVVLGRIRGQLRWVGMPTIAPSPDGLVGMTWEGAHEHVNVQVLPDRRIEYFAEDLDTGDLWSDETTWGELSPELLAKLELVG